MEGGKAVLLRDDYCDGLGDCLPTCPTGAISFVEREALEYDDAAVKANQKKLAEMDPANCSRLSHWPVQIQLAPIQAPYFDGAELLIAADCTAYAYGNFHDKFMKGKVTLIGCTKLDKADYVEKLRAIIVHNNIKSVTVTRMIVPCCGGIEHAVRTAVKESKKDITVKCIILSLEGTIK